MTHDPAEAAFRTLAPRRAFIDDIPTMQKPDPTCPDRAPRVTITEAELLRGYEVNNLAAVGRES